jgi:hypothetical protein
MTTSLELDWYSDVNRYADSASPAEWLPWYLAKGLSSETVSGVPAGSKWTVIASSNGTVAGVDDYWTDTFDAANIVADGPGSPHSWILLESPSGLTGGPYYMLIDCRYADHPEGVRVVFSAEAFDLSSLETENAPVTNDANAMMVFEDNTRTISSDGVFLGNMASVAQHYAHLRVATTGEFVFNTNYNLQGAFYSHIHFFETRDVQSAVGAFAGDTNPLQALVLGGGYISTLEISQYAPLGDYMFQDFGNSRFASISRTEGGGSANYTSAKVFSVPYPVVIQESPLIEKKEQYMVWSAAGGFDGASPWSALHNNATTGQLLGLAITCFSTVSTSNVVLSNYRGRVADVYTASYYTVVPPSTLVAINQGDVAPIPAVEGDPFLFVKIGAFWFPWNNSATPFM